MVFLKVRLRHGKLSIRLEHGLSLRKYSFIIIKITRKILPSQRYYLYHIRQSIKWGYNIRNCFPFPTMLLIFKPLGSDHQFFNIYTKDICFSSLVRIYVSFKPKSAWLFTYNIWLLLIHIRLPLINSKQYTINSNLQLSK